MHFSLKCETLNASVRWFYEEGYPNSGVIDHGINSIYVSRNRKVRKLPFDFVYWSINVVGVGNLV